MSEEFEPSPDVEPTFDEQTFREELGSLVERAERNGVALEGPWVCQSTADRRWELVAVPVRLADDEDDTSD